MQAKRIVAAFTAGLAGGAVLMLSTPLLASDPPAKARPAHGPSSGHGSPVRAEPTVPGPEIGFRGCAYFENDGFTGRRADVREGASVEWVGAAWNDRISSVACASGCRLIGYENINFGGARRNFSGTVAQVGAGWDDKISALRVMCVAEDAHAPGHEAATPEQH